MRCSRLPVLVEMVFDVSGFGSLFPVVSMGGGRGWALDDQCAGDIYRSLLRYDT